MTPRSHRVAQLAHDLVARRSGFSQRKEYGALAHKLPTMILQNGMAQATGFLLAKTSSRKDSEHAALLNDFAAVLRESAGITGCLDGAALHRHVIDASALDTMQLTRRGLEASAWIKRYVQGVLKLSATGDAVDEAPVP